MKTTYAQNNTRSLLLIIGSIVLALVLVVALLGLSEKPDVTQVAITPSGAPGSAGPDAAISDQSGTAADDGSAALGSTATLQPIPLDDEADAAPTVTPQPTAAAASSVASAAPGAVPVPTIVPTPTPTEIPEIAAAVEPLPTSLPADQAVSEATSNDEEPVTAAVTAGASGAPPSGTVTGNFFTRPDEDEGATVDRNEVELSFDESGGGSFRGVLDITYVDGSQVQIDMSGAFVYSPAPPQVMSTVSGTYRRDAVDDLNDVTTERGDLSITSFVSGSGALCTPTCIGFTFPPPGSS